MTRFAKGRLMRVRSTQFILSSAIFLSAGAALYGQNAAPAEPAPSTSPIVVARFEKTTTTKNLKVGDILTAKTLSTVKLSDGIELPKGSKLVGKVAMVKTKQEGNGNSLLDFRIDEAQVKGGGGVPVHGLVIAIGPSLGPKASLGQGSVMSREGQGSTPGLDPNAGLGGKGAKDETDIPRGSTLESVALGTHKDADWSTILQGVKKDIMLDSEVLIKVQLK
jgi:hypothetical protein